MVDLERAIVDTVEADPERRGTPEELRARVDDMGVDATSVQVADACDELVRAGEPEVVGERSDNKLYSRTKGK